MVLKMMVDGSRDLGGGSHISGNGSVTLRGGSDAWGGGSEPKGAGSQFRLTLTPGLKKTVKWISI